MRWGFAMQRGRSKSWEDPKRYTVFLLDQNGHLLNCKMYKNEMLMFHMPRLLPFPCSPSRYLSFRPASFFSSALSSR